MSSDIEQQRRLKLRLQYGGYPACIEEILRLDGQIVALRTQIETLRVFSSLGHGVCSALGGCDCPPDPDEEVTWTTIF